MESYYGYLFVSGFLFFVFFWLILAFRRVHSLLLLCRIPLCEWATVDLVILLLVDTWCFQFGPIRSDATVAVFLCTSRGPTCVPIVCTLRSGLDGSVVGDTSTRCLPGRSCQLTPPSPSSVQGL